MSTAIDRFLLVASLFASYLAGLVAAGVVAEKLCRGENASGIATVLSAFAGFTVFMFLQRFVHFIAPKTKEN